MTNEDDKFWYSVNSVIPEDIRPVYVYLGGGVTREKCYETEAEAIAVCIQYLHRRKVECDAAIGRYEKRLRELR